jgi:CDP-4-dehydro-6-deoxyglucose reductase, E1
MPPFRIPLVRDTIGQDDLDALADWLRGGPRLTKGPLCEAFEKKFAGWQDCRHAHYVNSGSSANLLAINALQVAGQLRPGDKVIAPAVSWTTTVAPITQFNCVPVLCDAEKDGLGLDLEHFTHLAKTTGARAVIICHVLGMPNRMDEILAVCERHGLTLIEDCCEALGSAYKDRKVGNFGVMSTFSFYFGHHMSTVEGGMVATNSRSLSNIIRSIRSHGWNRDLDEADKLDLRSRYSVDPFADQYTFYHPGFNFRGTDVGAFLGLRQLDKLPRFVEARHQIWGDYTQHTAEAAWQPRAPRDAMVSGFAWPVLSRRRVALAAELSAAGIETRPLICGSMGRQPWFVDRYGTSKLPNADVVHEHGLYVPINPDLTAAEVREIAGLLLGAREGSIREPAG